MDQADHVRLTAGILSIFVCLLLGAGIGLLIHDVVFAPETPLCGACPSYRCDYVRQGVSVQLIGQTSASGKGNILGINPTISVEVQNPSDTQPIRARAHITCKTLSRPSQTFSSEPTYLKPLEKYFFNFEYNIDNEDWSCTDFTATADEITGCELQQNQ